jgi:DNA replication and repair protein RecF
VGLQSLELRDFRLFGHLRLEPDPDAVTVLLSPNGTGKTSVLESVFALATASSFRTASAVDMIRNTASTAEVHGVIDADGRRVQVDLTLTRSAKHAVKKMQVNGQRPRSRADLSSALPVTVFTPEGVEMVRHGPEARRVFLTTMLTDVELRHGELVERFERLLRQRNAALRALMGRGTSPEERDELSAWTTDLATVGEELVTARRALTDDLSAPVARYYCALAGETVQVSARYEPSWSGDLLRALEGAMDDDRHRGYSTVGPHRDDLVLMIGERDARRQASQGEQRSLALALRLAGHELVEQRRRVRPLLLLDDVFSELDPGRSERLLALLPAGQTLVTTASPLPGGLHPAAVIDLTEMAA